MSTCISAVVAQAQVLAEKPEEQLAVPLDAGLDEEEGLQDEDEMYKNLLAAAPAKTPAQTDKQHVPRQIPPSMIIQIEQDEDVVIEVDNPYPQIGVEVVSKGSTVSKRHVLSTYGVCHSVPAVSSNVQTSLRIHGI